jgi:predicted DNA binding CopG/RHH family protein
MMKGNNKDKVINIRLSKQLFDDIKKTAKDIGELDTSSFIRLAIVNYINEIKKETRK